jgi:hypothetical protein
VVDDTLVNAKVSPIDPAAPLLDVCRTRSCETVHRGGVVVVEAVVPVLATGTAVVPPPPAGCERR